LGAGLPEQRTGPGSENIGKVGETTVFGGESTVRNAPDVGDLLSRSAAGTGVEIQYRSGVISDPRVRGYHVGQLVTYGDGGYYLPARQDLDTAVSKFDPGSVGDVIVLKGPYSVRYGPGFSFIDIATLNSPRYEHGFDWGGRTLFGYQTNGKRWTGLQSLWAGDAGWGFRATYDIRTGDDYRAGDDQIVPGGYNSQDVTYAFGLDISPDSRIEFKGLRLFQHDMAFPGLFFDINRLNTEAYSLRYILEHQPAFDRFTFDVWYNGTAANGDTTRGSKQSFLNSFLSGANVFNEPIQDMSSTNFNEESRGYRAAFSWGDKDTLQVAIGTDLNVVNQALAENIRLRQLDTSNPAFIGPNPNLMANLGIPPAQLVDPGIFIDTSVPVAERFNVKGGFRADWVTTFSHPRLVTGNVAIIAGRTTVPPFPGEATVIQFNPIVFSTSPNDTNLTRQFDLWSAYVNSDYKVDEHLTALAGFGFAQRPPTLTELYASGPFIALLQQGLNRVIGDPHLAPESLKQFDVGLKANYEGFRGGVNGFYAWVNNYITFDNAFGFLENRAGNQISQVVFTNTDLATLAGGELYSEVDATSWLTPFALVSYVQGRDLTHADNRRPSSSGVPFVGAIASSRRASNLTALSEPLPGIPPLELRWGLRVHQPDAPPRWAVEFGARSVLAQNLVATSLAEVETPGFTVLDFRAFWQVNSYLLVTGGVENFNDKFYREHLDPRAGDQLFRPGTNFYTSAELKY
jgi:outer membrane receptor protein involved in Fe transport